MIKIFIVLISFIGSVVCIDLASYPFLGTGYDLRLGIPDGPSIYTAEMDPGLKPTRYVIQLSDERKEKYLLNECPSYRILLNSRMIRRYVVDGNTWSAQLRNQIGDKLTFEEGDDFWSSMPLGHLNSVREVEELVAKNTTMITEEIWTVRAEARLIFPSSENPISLELRREICSAIKRSKNETDVFPTFFKRWGTHVITELTLGYKEVTRHLVRREDFLKYGLKGVLPVETLGRVEDFLNKGGAYTSSDISKILENLKSYQVIRAIYKLKFGDETLPLTPLRIQLVPLYKIAGKYECGTETVEETLKRAVKNYLQNE